MVRFVNAGNQVQVNADDVLCFCPASALPETCLDEAIDLSNKTKRSAILTRGGQILLVDVRFLTLKERLDKVVSARTIKTKEVNNIKTG